MRLFAWVCSPQGNSQGRFPKLCVTSVTSFDISHVLITFDTFAFALRIRPFFEHNRLLLFTLMSVECTYLKYRSRILFLNKYANWVIMCIWFLDIKYHEILFEPYLSNCKSNCMYLVSLRTGTSEETDLWI